MPGPRHFPYLAEPHRHRVGTRTLDPHAWIDLGPDADDQLAAKRRLLATRHDDVVQVCGGAPGPAVEDVEAAGQELLDTLVEHLVETYPDRYAVASDPGALAGRDRSGAVRRPPLADVRDPRTGAAYLTAEDRSGRPAIEAAAVLVPEDFCLHLPGPDGMLRLVAAAVAFPSGWVLREKVGRPIGAIHDPVPGYATSIGSVVDRILGSLTPDRGLWRLNGSLLADPRLHRPDPRPPPEQLRVPDDIVLRVERQTLRRLPVSSAVVFTIRTHVDPLASIEGDPARCAQLAAWVRGLPPELTAYKGMAGLVGPVLAWLDDRGAAG